MYIVWVSWSYKQVQVTTSNSYKHVKYKLQVTEGISFLVMKRTVVGRMEMIEGQ